MQDPLNNEGPNTENSGAAAAEQLSGVPLLSGAGEPTLAEEVAARHQAIIESSDDAIITTTVTGIITTWNRGAERTFGYSSAQAIGGSIHLIVPPDRSAEADGIMARIRRGERIRQFETLGMRKDGARIGISANIAPIVNDAGEVIGICKISRDITERKSLESQFRQAQKMEAVSRLAGGVAHDFNNLLGIISGYCELLLNDAPAGHPTHEYLTEIHRAGERAAALTRQLLAYSRKQLLVAEVVDPGFVVRDCESLLRHVMGEDVELTIVAAPDLSRARLDVGQLEQALINLAINAREAMPRGGKFTVETANVTLDETYTIRHFDVAPGKYVLLAASDTGVGMDQRTKAHIFEPFFTTKGQGNGTGLGLAMVFGFAKQSGGHVAFYSELGLGSTFKMYFPALEPAVLAEKTPEVAKTSRGSETILLVEDEKDLRKLARQILVQQGYNVLEAGDGREALRVTASYAGTIDLLISDVVMPVMGGAQLAGELAILRPGIRVLFMSGYTDDAVMRHGVLSSETAFIQKPFTVESLPLKVRSVLGTRS